MGIPGHVAPAAQRRGVMCAELRAAALAMALVLPACSIDIVRPKDADTAISDRSSVIRPGETGRAAVHAALGEPAFSSTEWAFDLFREDTVQTLVPVALTPWPVPFGRMKDTLYRYTLVTYAPDGRVSALASGVYSRPSELRRISPIERGHAALHLRVGELMFFVDPEGERRENLLVTSVVRDAWLARAGSSRSCTLLIGCGEGGCPGRITVDGGSPVPLPVRLAPLYWIKPEVREMWLNGAIAPGTSPPWVEALVAVQLSPGDHALKFSSRFLGGEHAVSLACREGEVAYLTLNATDNGRLFKRALVDWKVARLERMPENFARRPLVILHAGEWRIETGTPE